jgi:hypothetical protein
MIDYLFDLYGREVSRAVIVVRPADLAQVREYCATMPAPVPCEFAVQETPTGMLDAILLPRTLLLAAHPLPDRVWITWCDQIGIQPQTVQRLREASAAAPAPALAMPTAMRRDPYIHLARDHNHRITRVLHRREGDAMPDDGETDAGLFTLSREAYFDLLPQFADALTPTHEGAATRERNFLPFIPWLHARAEVRTFACESWTESVGVNTPEDAALIADNLSGHAH